MANIAGLDAALVTLAGQFDFDADAVRTMVGLPRFRGKAVPNGTTRELTNELITSFIADLEKKRRLKMTDPVARAIMIKELDEARAERDRYRDTLYGMLIAIAVRQAMAEFGAKSKALHLLLERQLGIREVAKKFQIVVVDPATGIERSGVSLADLLTDMRSSPDYAGAFETKPSGVTKLANNPWTKETWNATAQARLLVSNPGMAARMRREAGLQS